MCIPSTGGVETFSHKKISIGVGLHCRQFGMNPLKMLNDFEPDSYRVEYDEKYLFEFYD